MKPYRSILIIKHNTLLRFNKHLYHPIYTPISSYYSRFFSSNYQNNGDNQSVKSKIVRLGERIKNLVPDHIQNTTNENNESASGSRGIDMVEDKPKPGTISIRGVGHQGFFFKGAFHAGSVAMFNDIALKWNAKTFEELTIDHFILATLCKPRIDVIVLGTGKETVRPPENLLSELKKLAPVEYCSTFHAAATFNLLTMENRFVCAFLLSVDRHEEM